MESGNFEHALAKLETLVHRLERGDLPLEEGLTAFEEGVNLSRLCQDRLEAAEKRILTLSGEKAILAPKGKAPETTADSSFV